MRYAVRLFSLFLILMGFLGLHHLQAAYTSTLNDSLRNPGVVVKEVHPGGGMHLAGIQPGDILLTWNQIDPESKENDTGGRIDDPIALFILDKGKAIRQKIEIDFLRQGRMQQAILPPGDWKTKVRPNLSDDLKAIYEQGETWLDTEKTEEAVALWKQAAGTAMEKDDVDLAAWWYTVSARALNRSGDLEGALHSLNELLGHLSKRNLHCIEAFLLSEKGIFLDYRDRFVEAAELYEKSSGKWTDCLGATPVSAVYLMNAGMMYDYRGDRDKAGERYKKALGIVENHTPGSTLTADIETYLGILAIKIDDLPTAEKHYLRALAILDTLLPDSLEISWTLNCLGNLEWRRGNLFEGETIHKRALKIRERLDPGGKYLGQTLNNLGLIAKARGDYENAEKYYLQALKINEEKRPGSSALSINLNNLSNVYKERREFDKSREYMQRSIEIYERISPDSLDLAQGLLNISSFFLVLGEVELAESYLQRAFPILNKQAPESFMMALYIRNLSEIYIQKGDEEKAAAHFKKALEIAERVAPGGLQVAAYLTDLGIFVFNNKMYDKAESYITRAGRILEKIAPHSSDMAEVHHLKGSICRVQKKYREALVHYRRAVETLEVQEGRLGGGEDVLQQFRASFADYYRDLVEMQVRVNEEESAFHTLEQFRARNLLNILAERDLTFSLDIPEALAREQKRLYLAYDEAQDFLADLSVMENREKIEEGRRELRRIRDDLASLKQTIRQSSPRLAALQYPEPLDLEGVRNILNPGDLFLSFCVGKEFTYLFTMLDGNFKVHKLPVSRKELKQKVFFFHRLLSDPGSDNQLVVQRGEELFELLLSDAADELRRAKRLLVCPDGPLHILSFAALAQDDKFLAEQLPVFYVVSATVYAEILKSGRRGSRATRLVAFGSPVYASDSPQGEIRYGTRDIRKLSPLPATEAEVKVLVRLFPERSSLFTGEKATEEEARRLGTDATHIHFACHGVLDPIFPLNSGLVLSLPGDQEEGRENGILQAWEIFEQLRIDADLVTLSACQTALGKEMEGEGMIGLTRAFQYAGARSIVSSLWRIMDESTADFMVGFYTHIREGRSVSEALHKAQVSFIQSKTSGKDFSHPFYWAAFQLHGDGR